MKLTLWLTALTSIGALMGRSRFIAVGEFDDGLGRRDFARQKGDIVVTRASRSPRCRLQGRSTLPYPRGLPLRITHGPLSSGEGLIAAIRDALDEEDEGGTDDKRLLVVDGELGAGLRSMQRQENTLSMVLRTAWDGNELAPLIKRDRTVATDPHICLIGHITLRELRDLLNANDVWGGLVNRVLWACVRRHAIVPCPKAIGDEEANKLAAELARVAVYAHERPAELRMSNSAADHWAHVYPELIETAPACLVLQRRGQKPRCCDWLSRMPSSMGLTALTTITSKPAWRCGDTPMIAPTTSLEDLTISSLIQRRRKSCKRSLAVPRRKRKSSICSDATYPAASCIRFSHSSESVDSSSQPRNLPPAGL